MKKIYALFLVKRNSQRLIDKNILDFNGQPMFMVNVEKCLQIFEQVWVSSDSWDILEIADKAGARTIKRPSELCGEVPNIPVYQHAQIEMQADAIVAVHACSPNLNPKLLVTAKGLMDMGYDEIMSCHPMTHSPNYHTQHNLINGSIWGLSRERLSNYKDAYKPEPEILLVDESIDINLPEDYRLALCESTLQ